MKRTDPAVISVLDIKDKDIQPENPEITTRGTQAGIPSVIKRLPCICKAVWLKPL